MKKEKELFIFPILSIIFSILFILSLLFPSIILTLINGDEITMGALEWGLLFLTYFGLAFISTFFNVCVVKTSAEAFNNKQPTFGSTISFVFSKIHLIFAWSLISATMGLLLKSLENIAERAKGVGSILLLVTRGFIGMTWSLITIFIIPIMVYEGLGPFASIKKSTLILRKTWGENIIRFLGMGLMLFLFLLLGITIGSILIAISIPMGLIAIITSISIIVIYFLSVIILFGVANQIYNTALYIYSQTGNVPADFSKEDLAMAFKPRKGMFG